MNAPYPQSLIMKLTFFPVSTGESLAKPHNPLAALGIGGVFPRRFDTFTKEVIVGSIAQIIGSHEIIIRSPKLFDTLDSSNGSNGTLIGIGAAFRRFFLAGGISFSSFHVPKGIP